MSAVGTIALDATTNQGYPVWPKGYKPTADQWAAIFASKADAGGLARLSATVANLNALIPSIPSSPVVVGVGPAYAGEIYPETYGAKGDAVDHRAGIIYDNNQFSIPGYTPSLADIGKTVMGDFEGYGPSSVLRTVTAVDTSTGYLTASGSALPSGHTGYIAVGTDDTAAIQAALDAALILPNGENVGDGLMPATGNTNFGGVVQLSGGRTYLIGSNKIVQGNAAVLRVHRRTSLRGEGMGNTRLLMHGGAYGDGIANSGIQGVYAEGGHAYDDFITLSNFLIQQPLSASNNGAAIAFVNTFNGYDFTDNFSRLHNIMTAGFQYGFYIKGRGEIMAYDCVALGAVMDGWYVNVTDSAFHQCNAGGAGHAGIHLYSCANGRFSNCKSYYSGHTGDGANSPGQCANWWVEADQFRNGNTIFVACEAQESKGSGWVIASGQNQLIGCRSCDPGRTNGRIETLGNLPTVRAGFHLQDQRARMNVFAGSWVGSAVALFNNGQTYGTNTSNWGKGTNCVELSAGAEANNGTIATMVPTNGPPADPGLLFGPDPANGNVTYGPVGGAAWTKTMNPGLTVNGVAAA